MKNAVVGCWRHGRSIEPESLELARRDGGWLVVQFRCSRYIASFKFIENMGLDDQELSLMWLYYQTCTPFIATVPVVSHEVIPSETR